MNNNITVSELFGKVQADLDHWEKKRQGAESTLREANAKTQELQQMLNGLRSYLPDLGASITPVQNRSNSGEFAKMSIREAIKVVLQREGIALTTPEIAKRLTDAGATSESASFRSNVSATLSVMQSKHREVHKTPQGWVLSQPNLVAGESRGEAA